MGKLKVKVSVAQLCQTLCDPLDCRRQAPLSIEFSRQEHNTELPFLTQGSNLRLLHWRWILYHLSYQGSPNNTAVEKESLKMQFRTWGGWVKWKPRALLTSCLGALSAQQQVHLPLATICICELVCTRSNKDPTSKEPIVTSAQQCWSPWMSFGICSLQIQLLPLIKPLVQSDSFQKCPLLSWTLTAPVYANTLHFKGYLTFRFVKSVYILSTLDYSLLRGRNYDSDTSTYTTRPGTRRDTQPKLN